MIRMKEKVINGTGIQRRSTTDLVFPCRRRFINKCRDASCRLGPDRENAIVSRIVGLAAPSAGLQSIVLLLGEALAELLGPLDQINTRSWARFPSVDQTSNSPCSRLVEEIERKTVLTVFFSRGKTVGHRLSSFSSVSKSV
jgi:hypothetical protein